MCRILMIREDAPFAIETHLSEFAQMCRDSQEYQGHGWGIAYRLDNQWHHHKTLTPIWESDLRGFGTCDFLVVHARSAFKNEGIQIENNMPFFDEEHIFIFNGELHGVRLKVEGRIGAEKIFRFIKRLYRDDMGQAFRKATDIIGKQSKYVRGMNILMTDGIHIFLKSRFGEDPNYFTLYRRQAQGEAFCSQPLSGTWTPIANHTTLIV